MGSFCGVCVYRYVHGIPMRGRSSCPRCKKQLWPRHLVPILSWIFLEGRCPFCRSPIGFATLFVECLYGLIAALLAAHYGHGLAFAATLLFFGALIVLSGIDAACYVLPDVIIAPLAPVALFISVWILHMNWLESLTGGLVSVILLFGLRRFFFVVRGVEALGLGDVKLMLPLGFMCGLYNMPLLLLTASLSGLAAMAWRLIGTPHRSSIYTKRIPFGPFLAFGCFITVPYGEQIRVFLV